MASITKPNTNDFVVKDTTWIDSLDTGLFYTYEECNFNAYSSARKLIRPKSEQIDIPKHALEILFSELRDNELLTDIHILSEKHLSPDTILLLPKQCHIYYSSLIDSSPQSINLSNAVSLTAKLTTSPGKGSIYVLNLALEASNEPTYILRRLRSLLKQSDNNRLIVVSKNCSSNADLAGASRLPKDIGHYREWSTERLATFLKSSGFNITNIVTAEGFNIFTLNSDEISHQELLKKYGLPHPKNSMIITTEHADTKSTGGIGSYVKEVEQVLGQDRPIVMTVTPEPFKKIMVTNDIADNIIDIHNINESPAVSEHTSEWHSASIEVYKAVKKISFIYDQIHNIEYQEYQGIGARIAQAKQSGELYPDLNLVARCHGSQVYIDRASFGWSGMNKADVFELERLSVNFADEVSFPTAYLRDLYKSTGYDIKENNSYVQRLPYSFPDAPDINYDQVNELIFLGKRSYMKGFPDFCNMISEITDKSSDLYNPNISSVNVIAAPGDASALFDDQLKEILYKRNISFKIGPVPRHEVLSMLKSAAPNAIICLPYGGDNHPVTILEMIANKCRFVAYSNGGIPELVPKSLHDIFLCLADPRELAIKINNLASIEPNKVDTLMNDINSQSVSIQKEINQSVIKSYRSIRRLDFTNSKTELSDVVTVMIPVYNTALKYVLTLIKCINKQTLPPKEVLFINDCSPDKKYVNNLHDLIKKHMRLPYRIIDHPKNRGLAGARNTGLHECTTKYLVNIDSDDVVGNDFLFDYVNFMEEHPGYSACTSGLESFVDSDGWNRRPAQSTYSYVGLGSCFILGVSKNIFGHAGSCVNTNDARKIGGWDESDRSKWEDWAFFLKMTSSGMNIFNFPKTNYFYRVSPGSMARTYANYPAEMRIARNISGLSIWESHRLYAFIKDEAEHTSGSMHYHEPDTLTYRVAKRISRVMSKSPALKRVVRKSINSSWHIYKKLSNKN